MKEGDILEWNNVNGICRGIVTYSEQGELICKVNGKTAFPLKDLRTSFSLRIISA